jgi:hypothetical protein
MALLVIDTDIRFELAERLLGLMGRYLVQCPLWPDPGKRPGQTVEPATR